MKVRDAEATRDRILRAAIAEFGERGLAGGRVERIAQGAEANVRMVYAYFGDKIALFDAAVVAAVRELTEAVPPTPDDLAGWAGRLFDYHGRAPAAMRLSLWAQLERPQSASEPMESYLAKTHDVESAARPPMTAVDLLAVVYAVAQAWYVTPIGLLTADGSTPGDSDRRAAHRAAVVSAVGRMLA